jgi:hypothetical protein
MLFVCQLNLTAAPAVPALIEDVQLITFYVDSGLCPKAKESGGDWRIFAYSSLSGLVPMPRPSDAPKLRRGAECRWEACDDHPNSDDPERQVPEGFDDSDVELDNVARTKVGGYASTVQSEPWWGYEDHPGKPAFWLQDRGRRQSGPVMGRRWHCVSGARNCGGLQRPMVPRLAELLRVRPVESGSQRMR